jgi:hypothetical protein
VISLRNTLAGTNLKFPLAWHDLSIDARDLDASIEASLVMSLYDCAAKHAVSANSAVVWTLRLGIPTFGPANDSPAIRLEQRVLLLKTEPGYGLGDLRVAEDLSRRVTSVGGERLASRCVAVTKDEDIITSTERIREDGARLDNNLRVMAGSLAGGAAIKVPFRKLRGRRDRAVEGPGLAADVLPRTTDPDVLGNDLTALVQISVAMPAAGFAGGR